MNLEASPEKVSERLVNAVQLGTSPRMLRHGIG